MQEKSMYLRQIFHQMVIWIFALGFYSFIRRYGREIPEETEWLASFTILNNLAITILSGIVSGWLFGSYQFLFRKFMTGRMSFRMSILLGTMGYIIVVIFFLVLLFVSLNLFFDAGLSRTVFWDFLTTGGGIIIIVYCLVVGFLIEFGRQIDRKFGPGNLLKMLRGDFFHPKEEVRIFMFLDLRSSTTIAEKLGHLKYSRLIQDCFKDIDVVVPYQAEIYQYVGDEVVLIWDQDQGLSNSNCVKAFYAFKDQLFKRASYYQAMYGLIPEFKAGMNIGTVTVAEVGEIKKDIAYHGDTINTAARIQSQCNDLGFNFLSSEMLIDKLPHTDGFDYSKVGSVKLRGKMQEVGLYSIERM